jgi:Long-chain acyl-CoA synthetases (AMP-forming)
MNLDLSSFQSLGEAFMESFAANKNRVALIEVDRELETARFSFSQLREESLRLAALLQKMNFAPGDHLAIVMSNQSKWIISAVAAYLAGGVVIPIDYKLSSREQAAYLNHCRARIVVTEWPLYRKWRDDGTEAEGSAELLVTDAPAGEELARAQRWESSSGPLGKIQERKRDDVCAILYSSGTGGRMKGCMLTHANYLTQVENFSRRLQMRKGERYLSVLPTNHGIDFVFGFLYPMLLGATVVHQRTLRPQYLHSTLKDYRINMTSLVPIILKELQKRIQESLAGLSEFRRKVLGVLIALNRFLTPSPKQWLSKRFFPKIHRAFGGELRAVLTGGSFVDHKLARFFYDLGIFVGIGYGLTEAGTTVSAPDWGKYHDDTVGKPLSNTQLEVRNPDENGVGEIWIKGPSVMKGYFEDPELTEEYLVDGWLRTDDLGSLDSKRNLRIVGRKKNIIVTSGGENIYPEDVEGAFELPELKEFCVFGTNYLWPDTSLLEEKLFIVVHPDGGVKMESVIERLRAQNRALPDQKRVAGFLPWGEDFPRTGSLKIIRHLLAQKIAATRNPADIRKFP